MSPYIRAVALTLALTSCAASVADVKKARDAQYQTDYDTIWNAVSQEMHQRFKDNIKIEDKANHYIESSWKLVGVDQDAISGDTNQQHGSRAQSVASGMFLRMRVRILGGPPWRLDVDGEGAAFQPNMSMLIPYKHGAPDEPELVPGRIDSFYTDIYARLKGSALDNAPPTPQPGPAPAIAPSTEPTPDPQPGPGGGAPGR